MTFADQINELLSNDPPEVEAALEWVSGASAEQLYELLQGLDPTLPGTVRIAEAACAKLRKLADDARGKLLADLQAWAQIAEADADAIRSWIEAWDAAKKANTARARADQLKAAANQDPDNPDAQSAWQSAERDAQMAEAAAKSANDRARDSITVADGLRMIADFDPLTLELPADQPVAPAAGTTPKVKLW